MKIVKIITLVLLFVFVGIQFIPTTRNHSNSTPKTDFIFVNNVPKSIHKKLKVSCYDCHSNNTEYPWYNRIQPVAWLLENHIKEGKSELNFSEWENYSNRRKKNKLKSIISQIEKDKMPMYSYMILHGEAKLSENDKKALIIWVSQLRDSLK